MPLIRVLLVDDSVEFLASASALLTRMEHVQVVGSASSATEGVELAVRLTPDLVLMDLTMPVMNGFTATTLIKSRPAPPVVVVVTLHGDQEYHRSAREAGADALICKSDFVQRLPAVLDALFPLTRSALAAEAAR